MAITTCLWFAKEAEEAAHFYVSLLPDSRVDVVVRSPVPWPGGAVGEVLVVEFTLAGQSYMALNGGPATGPTQAVSFVRRDRGPFSPRPCCTVLTCISCQFFRNVQAMPP